ncbi:MAG: TatD family hydrolase [Acidobacteriota bacterium]|nr:TatD family hydrolase [Acidobacteriota bacterium]
MLIDSHTHLESFAQKGELPAVLARARAAGVERLVTVGTSPEDWDHYRRLSSDSSGTIAFTVGLHPCAVEEGWEAAVARMRAFWDAGSGGGLPVGLGECGLDRYHLSKDPADAGMAFARQQAAFQAQLALARDLKCPLVVHSRGAYAECVEAIDASGVDWNRVVFHCFAEGPAEMAALRERGGRGSFTGILTYRNADAVRAAAQTQGIEKLMLETDAPYLAPAPHRGKANEPSYLRHTFDAAAALFGVPADQLETKIAETTAEFFSL